MRTPDFWTATGPAANAVSLVLSPVGALYGLAGRLARRRARPFRAHAKVLCVGNLTAGGSGKTPVAIALARRLAMRSIKTIFLTRGYGGRAAGPVRVDASAHHARDIGDEALLLAAAGPTIVSRDRAAGAALADAEGADVIIMDDGYQNFGLVKDVSLLVVDAETGFGNGRLIPAGPLRERIADGLVRADAVVLMGKGATAFPGFHGPVVPAQLVPNAPEALQGRSVFAFAGIGRPEKFFATLRALGADLVGRQGFADHHVYSGLELSTLHATAEKHKAILVTTEKDYVRIAPADRKGIVPVPVHAVVSPDPRFDALLDTLASQGD